VSDSLSAALAAVSPSEVTFGATVVSSPHFFYGRNTHATHEAFRVLTDDGHRLEVVDNVKLAPRVPVAPGDHVTIRGELVPHGSHGPLVHYTHHDPQHVHPDGFIELAGHLYA